MARLINRITELFVKIKDSAGNGITSTDLGGGKRALDVAGSFSASIDRVRIRDINNENQMLSVNSDGSINERIFDKDGNGITSSEILTGKRGIDVSSVALRDGETANLAKVDEAGNLFVKTVPLAPPGTLPVEIIARSSVPGSSVVDIAWVIPLNTKLTIQKIVGGQYPVSGDASAVELNYDDSGAITASSYLISLGYIGTGEMNYHDDLNIEYIGNNIAAIIARRQRINATARLMYIRWVGYLTYTSYTTHVSGNTTSVSSTSITDTSKNWVVNTHVGRYVMLNDNTPLRIVSNTNNTLTVIGNSQLSGVQPYKIISFNA